MPILPLDHPEPLAAVLGVMHYPGTDDDSRAKARAFAAKFLLARPLPDFFAAGGELSHEILKEIALDAGVPVDDWSDRHFSGTATGELLKVHFALYRTDPALASWANAQRIAEVVSQGHGTPGSVATLYKLRGPMMSVAHLWGALSIRNGRWVTDSDTGYQGWHDVEFFLAEAEVLRRWGQTWHPPREKSFPPLPADAWQTPPSWAPPERQPGWPRSGGIPDIGIDPDLIARAGIRKSGRPTKKKVGNPL